MKSKSAQFACALVASLVATRPGGAEPVVFITAANRGIGFALASQDAGRGWIVIATARDPRGADARQALARANGKVRVERLDVTSDRSVRRLAKKYTGRPIDVPINNAGILGDVPAQQLGAYDFEVFGEIMDVNVKGPLRMTEAFIGNVAASRGFLRTRAVSRPGERALSPITARSVRRPPQTPRR
jgi:NAD(P)-dependent dehydrogenase (short-subunit alcohol dehydrogenase family)